MTVTRITGEFTSAAASSVPPAQSAPEDAGSGLAVILELTERQGFWKERAFLEPRQKNAGENSGVKDESGRLTRLLVAAKTQEEVRYVLSEAYNNLSKCLLAAAGGDKKAAAIVRRLKKLIIRANRKIRDLNREDGIKQNQKRAEKKMQEELARGFRAELKRAETERKLREQKYQTEITDNR